MSVLKNKDTDLHLRAERKAKVNFLVFYTIFVILFMGFVSFYYYKYREDLMFQDERIMMMEFATEQARKIKQLHYNYPSDNIYPRAQKYKSAIYDLEHKKIFSLVRDENIELDKSIYRKSGHIYLIKILDDYYLGAKYLIIEVTQNNSWITSVANRILFFGFVALILLAALGRYLAIVFVRPMRNSMLMLDRFIHDTTHELNTPISTILANIEMINRSSIGEKNKKYIKRIELGAKSVSVLYEDLKFLTLEKQRHANNKELDLSEILEERLEYFAVMIESKQIHLVKEISKANIVADRRLMNILFDNLISNAIKYNVREGKMKIFLQKNNFYITDSGIGMTSKEIKGIFERYKRYNNTEGGFGIGLNIVAKIAEYYNMQINVISEPNKGTRVEAKW